MRLFLSLAVPKEVSDGLVAALDRADLPRVRITPRNMWHVTLAFLGDVPEVDVDLINHACQKFQACPGSIMVDRLETFPSGGPRLLAGVGKESPRDAWNGFIEELRGDMLTFAPEIDRKPWRPHITVGKGPTEGVIPNWGIDIGPWTWKPDGFRLMESIQSPDHLYRTLHEFPFTR